MAKSVSFMRCGLGIFMYTFASASQCHRPNIPSVTGNVGNNFLRTKGFYRDGSILMMCAARCLADRRFCNPFGCMWDGEKVSTHSYPISIWPQRLKFSIRSARTNWHRTKRQRKILSLLKRKDSRRGTKQTKPTISVAVTSGTTKTTKKSRSSPQIVIQNLKEKCERKRNRNFGFRFHKDASNTMCLALKNGKRETFPDAEKLCERFTRRSGLRGRLVVADTNRKIKLMNEFLETENDRNFFFQNLKHKESRIWIGLRGNDWVDGPKIINPKFANVAIEDDTGLCVSIKVDKYTWKYERCKKTWNFYVCELY